MLRGTQKQIIHLKHTESPLFEEAFLIVKKAPPRGVNSRTLAEEATRMLAEDTKEETPPPVREKKNGMYIFIPSFLLGVACGAAVLTLCFLL